MAAASAWDIADHALAPVLGHPAYPYFFVSALVLTTVLGWHILRRVMMVQDPSEHAALVAKHMVELGSRAPAAGAIEAAVTRGIHEALAPIAEEFRKDIRDILVRLAYLEAHRDNGHRWDGRDRRQQR
jgi:hypothetical protein